MSLWFKIVCVVATVLSGLAPVSAKEVVTIANGEWSPYASKELKYDGLVSRIVKDAFAEAGVEVAYRFLPWKRGYQMAQLGKLDGQMMRSRNAEREKYFVFSDPILESQSAYFHLKSYSFDWENLSDLKGRRIGGTIGYNYGAEFLAAERRKDIAVHRVPTDIQNFKKLVAGRIDIFPCNTIVGYYLINKNLPPADAALITHNKRLYVREPLYLLLSKKTAGHKELVQRFNVGLKALRERGVVDRYIQEFQRGEYDPK